MGMNVLDLTEHYLQGFINRRDFLRKLALLTGGIAGTNAVFSIFEQNLARAQITAPHEPLLRMKTVTFGGEGGEVSGYWARPKGDEILPGVVVVHENRGLNDHIKDVGRRIALEGFLTLSPDALSPAGGTPDDPDKARSMINALDPQKNLGNFLAAVKYLQTHPESTGKVGVVGFCWGGGMANQLAVNAPGLVAAVPYYGKQPASEDVPKIKASLLLHYAGLDDRINKGIPDFEAALKASSIDYQIYMYDGAKHAFNNDTNPERYNKEAAQLAWERTISFFKEKLIP